MPAGKAPAGKAPAEKEWGHIDDTGTFRSVPKRPLRLAELEPPCEVRLWDGRMRRIVERLGPDAAADEAADEAAGARLSESRPAP